MADHDTAETVENILRRHLEEQRYAVLATSGTGGLHTNIVAFDFDRGLRYIYFFTPERSRKYYNIASNHMASLFNDNRDNRTGLVDGTVGITATGFAQELDDDAAGPLVEAFIQKHPLLEQYARDPGVVWVRVMVIRYSMVTGFDRVQVYEP